MQRNRRRPETCPRCGQEYFVRVPNRYDHRMTLGKLYRCRATDGYLYLHHLEFGMERERTDPATG